MWGRSLGGIGGLLLLAPCVLAQEAGVRSPFNPQTVGTSFVATQSSESIFIPPDATGDVGPGQVLVATDGRIKVFDRNGNPGGLNSTTDDFFASVGGVTNGTTQPRIRFDRLSGRWFVTMLTVNDLVNDVLIAVSSGPTITDGSSFSFFSFQHDQVGPTPNVDTNGYVDYDTLGVDRFALYIGVNVFDEFGFYLDSTGFVVNKADLLSGTLTVTAFRHLVEYVTDDGPFTPQGVNNDDPSATEGYFIGVDYNVSPQFMIRRISDPGGTPSISANISVTVPPTEFPIPQVQPPTPPAPPLDAAGVDDRLDDRLSSAAIQKNKITGVATLWTAHNIEVNSSGVAALGGGRNGSRWYEIGSLTAAPALVQAGTLFDPASTNPVGYWIPSVAASGQGHMAMGSSRASADPTTGFAGIATAGRLRTDPQGTTQAPTVAQAGSAVYAQQRWGDYSQTVVDPNDDMTMWTFQQYATSGTDWAVRAVRLGAPPPATPSCGLPAIVTTTGQQDVVITGTSVLGSGFFDPGPDAGGPGYPGRLTAAVTGGTTVNSVTFNSPTSVTLNITATTLGFHDVTITNPDGQSVAGVGCIAVPVPADLSITKSDGLATAVPGQAVTYTIVASNAGPYAVTGATVTDLVPGSLTGATWTCLGAGGGSCAASGTGSISDTVNLPMGGTATYTLTATVGPNPQSLRNTATITLPAGVTDPNPGDNSATDVDMLVCNSEAVVVADGRVTPSSIGAGATAWFGASLKMGDSYSLELATTTETDVPPGILTVFKGDDGCSLTSPVVTAVTTGIDPGGGAGLVRVSFVTSGLDPFYRAMLWNQSPGPILYTVAWSDTTLYSPAWSTNGSFNTFYSFQNTTGSGLNGTLTLADTSGAVQSTFAVSIPAGQTVSSNTSALGAARNKTGTARFTHDGPPGAVIAEAAIANFTISPAYVQPVRFQAVREAR